MAGVVSMWGGSFAIRPHPSRPALSSLAWTTLVVATGILIAGRLPAAGLLLLAVVAGLPHGATDLGTANQRFSASGRAWWAPFLTVYLALIAATLAIWAMAPTAMLVGFLLLSVVHFGMQDVAGMSDRPTWVSVIAHGGVPIVVPAVVHPGEVVRLFATLVGDRAAAAQALVAGPIAIVWAGAIGFMIAQKMRRTDSTQLAGVGMIGLLFVATPPLVAFAFYFALLHTPRAFLTQRAKNNTTSLFWIVALTALACGIGLIIYRLGSPLAASDNLVRASFMLLSALTIPHMALDWFTHVHPRTDTCRLARKREYRVVSLMRPLRQSCRSSA